MTDLETEFENQFTSKESKDLFNSAVQHILAITDSDNVWRARAIVAGIAGYVMRDYADRLAS